MLDKISATAEVTRHGTKLSPTQEPLVALVARGLLNKQIAWELGCAEATVKARVGAALKKLGCGRRSMLTITYLHGLDHEARQAFLDATMKAA